MAFNYSISSAGKRGKLSASNRILHNVVKTKAQALSEAKTITKDGYKNVRIKKWETN